MLAVNFRQLVGHYKQEIGHYPGSKKPLSYDKNVTQGQNIE